MAYDNNQNNQGFRPQRKPNAFDTGKMKLFAKCPTNPEKKSTLEVVFNKNNPMIRVRTNSPDELNENMHWGRIDARMSTFGFYALIAAIREINKSDENKKIKLSLLNYTFFNKERSKEPKPVSFIYVGKLDGATCITVVDDKHCKPVFVFALDNYHELSYGDGTPMSSADSSRIAAEGWCLMMENLLASVANKEFVEPEDKPKSGGFNNQNQNNRSSYGRQNNQQESDSGFDSADLPF